MDKSIAYSSGARVVAGIAGVGTVFFISTFLTGVEQGFYFTFGSLLAMQVFFELGLTGIMTQFVAHEVSHLKLNENNEYEGDKKYKSRLASLIRFCLYWYSVLSLLSFIFLFFVGYAYFNRYGAIEADVSWGIPWLLICFGTAIKLLQSPFNSIFMGLGLVKEMSKISFYQQLIIPITSWIGLVLGLKLYVMGISYLFSVLIWQLYVWKNNIALIVIKLWKIEIRERVSYIKEIYPYQWKIALSWVSGYFIFQLFNPVLFASEGAIVAGQMGMTMTVLSSISAMSMSWMNTKIPIYSQLISLGRFAELDGKFSLTLKQLTFVCSFLLILFTAFLFLLDFFHISLNGNELSTRFLTIIPTSFLMITVLLQQFTSSWATYLRCHKKEPFLIYSICTGVLCMISTLTLGKFYGLYGVICGYFTIQFLFFPWGYYIYKTKRKQWHQKQESY